MKPFYPLVFVLLFAGLDASGQWFKGGLSAGIVGSQVAGDTYSGYHKAGIYAGAWIQLPLNQHATLQSELCYFQKGSRHNPDVKGPDSTSMTFYLMRLGYIEMPFLYQYTLSNNLTFEGGPSFGFLLHSREEDNIGVVDYGKFRLFNPSLVLGISYKLNDKVSVHFRNNSSILSIRSYLRSGAVWRFVDHGQYNDAITFFISYQL